MKVNRELCERESKRFSWEPLLKFAETLRHFIRGVTSKPRDTTSKKSIGP